MKCSTWNILERYGGKEMAKPQKSALGRGLSSLISNPITLSRLEQNDVTENSNELRALFLDQIDQNPDQPRQEFKEQELRELSDSIKALGLIQPVVVKAGSAPGRFIIVAGERRWRAAKMAGLAKVPVIVRDLSERETLELAIVENVQRQGLNPIEEAKAYERLATEFQLTQSEVAERVGKDRTTVANMMRLLKLPAEVLENIRMEKLSLGHAKAILGIKEPSAQLSLARKVIAEQLSVRALEGIVSRVVVLDGGRRSNSMLPTPVVAEESKALSQFTEVMERLRRALGTKVQIKHARSGKGRLEIEYFSESDLDRIVEKICAEGR
jgi:ParB family transcriptional regulator, chromosome partitioning protein